MDNIIETTNLRITNKMIKLCKDNYTGKTLSHAIRVADYVLDNVILFNLPVDKYLLYYCALAHDLIEDTDVTYEEVKGILNIYNSEKVENTLKLLTHNKERESYVDYIKRIRESGDTMAYIIKIADMKDHLTLLNAEDCDLSAEVKEKLKKKYDEALPYLL